MDRHQPPVSASVSQNLSSQVSTLTLNISCQEKDSLEATTAENLSLQDGITAEGNSSDKVSDDGDAQKAFSPGLRVKQTHSNTKTTNSLQATSLDDKVKHSTSSNFSIGSIDSLTLDKENVRSEDLLADFYNALNELHAKALEDLVFTYNIDVNLVFNSHLGFIKRKHFGWRAVHIVASRGSAKIVEFLLHQGSDLNLLTPDGDSALHIAAKNGAADVIQLLLEYNVFLRDRPNNQGITALLKAVFNSQHAFKGSYHRCVDLLLGAGCNPNISSSSLVTALHVAVGKGDQYLVQRLINAGANVNALCDQESSPLLRALISKHINTEIITSLLLTHADTNVKINGRSLLHIAVSRCDDHLIETFVQFGADTNFKDGTGKTPLWVAVEENNIKVVPILVSGGADINYVRPPQCISVLSQAVLNNSFPMVKLLLDLGASAYTETFLWSTPLHMAVDQQNTEIVQELLRVNCPLNTSSNAKCALLPMTPIQLAMELGNVEIVFLLLQSGSRVNRLWLRQDRMSPALASKPDVVLCIQKYLQEVPSLLHLSRLSIREFLGERFTDVVSQMKDHSVIPSKIVDYLSLKDILD